MSGRWGYQRDGIPPPARHDQPRPVGRTAEEPGHGGELGEPGRQVRHYFREDRDLKDYSTARGWQDKYASVADLHTQATFTFLEQPRDDRYGILRTRPFAGHQLLDELLEKPNNYGEATAYINISRTLLPAHALAYFEN
ncbi:hypothetical protein O7628_29475 [Micromonospora sp. WMMD956]|uniref:hypothetical protein n=1 Tax=Micromonospora sp. WMMD956 TaxID=3016108 RepID=UPI002416D7BB|nr:hypothetical protein [Micromonospora sp. WMMD956]MDG4819632.1 hypothetical protein [Micromonospora sp. WMMD956]